MKTKLNISIDKELLEELREYCDTNYLKISNFVSMAIAEKLKEKKEDK